MTGNGTNLALWKILEQRLFTVNQFKILVNLMSIYQDIKRIRDGKIDV